MAKLGAGILTMADVAKTKTMQFSRVAEIYVRQNSILNDLEYYEMNMGTYHKELIRASLPEVYYRKANQAIPASKSEIEERSFNGTSFESKSEVDEAVAERGGLLAENRWVQAQGHIQSQGIEHADLIMNGSLEDSSSKCPGFFDVYSTVSGDTVGKQVIDGGGVGSDNTSILLVCLGRQTIFGVYPTGTEMGMSRKDDGKVDILGKTAAGDVGTFPGYRERFKVEHGLVVKDYRQGCRIANIDVLQLKAGNGLDLIEAMIDATYKIDSLDSGTPVFYVNRTIEAFLDKQARREVGAAGGLSYGDYQGKRVLFFRNIPIRRVDAIGNTQARVV